MAVYLLKHDTCVHLKIRGAFRDPREHRKVLHPQAKSSFGVSDRWAKKLNVVRAQEGEVSRVRGQKTVRSAVRSGK